MKPQRIEWIDALRGFAMLWMAIFHFAFDLNQYHYTHIDFQRGPPNARLF